MSEFNVQAIDLSGILNKSEESKASQLPKPATYHLLCVLPDAEKEYESGFHQSKFFGTNEVCGLPCERSSNHNNISGGQDLM